MPSMPRHAIAFALGFTVVFLGAGIAGQAQVAAQPVPMAQPPLVSAPESYDLWWLPAPQGDSAIR